MEERIKPQRIGIDIAKGRKHKQMRYWNVLKVLTTDENGELLTFEPYIKTCECCKKEFSDKQRTENKTWDGDIQANFYYDCSESSFDGYFNVCKSCLISACDDENGVINKEKLIEQLKILDKAYLDRIYDRVSSQNKSSKDYFTSLMSLEGQRKKRFEDSDKF